MRKKIKENTYKKNELLDRTVNFLVFFIFHILNLFLLQPFQLQIQKQG